MKSQHVSVNLYLWFLYEDKTTGRSSPYLQNMNSKSTSRWMGSYLSLELSLDTQILEDFFIVSFIMGSTRSEVY
jgi:hypothetical protein